MAFEDSLAKSRLKGINRAHDAAHAAAHDAFRRKYNELLIRHGVSMRLLPDGKTDLTAHFDLPPEFHEDLELQEARDELLMSVHMAAEARKSSAAQTVRRRPRQ